MLWHSESVDKVLKELGTTKEGLSKSEVLGKIKQYGPNRLDVRKKVSYFSILIRQFRSPFVYMLVIAGLISIFLGELTDSYIIFAAVVLTIFFSFFQEAKAEKTLEALQSVVEKKARVIRDGRITEVDADHIVPGDIIVIGEGDRISADGRIIEESNLRVDESALTGESLPQDKGIEPLDRGVQVSDQENMIFRGTLAVKGRAKAVVISTGRNTEIGKIAESISDIGEVETPLQKKLANLAKIISIAVVIVLVILVVTGLFRDISLVELLTTSIAVAVAAIPESLIAVMTVILAVGMVRLLKAKALVRKLIAAETLGSTNVVCVDKTGTLTEGSMSVSEIFSLDQTDEDKKFAMEIGMATNEAYFDRKIGEADEVAEAKGDPTETAILLEGRELGLLSVYEEHKKNTVDEIPFDSDNQFMATLVEKDKGHNRLFIKGSPEKLLSHASFVWENNKQLKLSKDHKKKIEENIERLSGEGYRLIAVAYRDLPKEIGINGEKVELSKLSQLGEDVLEKTTFVGIIALADPLRSSVVESIKIAQDAGVRVVMITGDHKLTAQNIAREIGIPAGEHNIILGEDLSKMSDDELIEIVPHINIYGRIVPHDKLRIVEALQKTGASVAMTGDGVNDAPALKKADIGVAMGSGQDVAKEASDLVVLDNDFSTIIRAVKEGRVMLDNIRKVTLYLLKDSFTEIILLATALIAGLPLPIIAAQVLWINIVEDGLPSFALSYEPPEDDVMKRPPEPKDVPFLTREMRIIIFAVGIFSDLLLLGTFIWFYVDGSFSIEYIRTLVFAGLALNSLLVIFSLKSLRTPIYKIAIFNNWYLIGSVIFGLAMLAVAMYVPFFSNLLDLRVLSSTHWFLVIVISLVQLILIEIVKWWFVHRSTEFVPKNA